MKIGIDALYIRPGRTGGTESYLRNLLKGLEEADHSNEYYIFTSATNCDTFHFENKNFTKIICAVNGESRIKRVLFESFRLPGKIDNLALDLMFFPTYIRTFFTIKKVITVSNLHDIQYKHYPRNFSKIQKLMFNIFYPVSLKKSDHIICISNFVKNDLIHYFPRIHPEKYHVIYNPIDFLKFDQIQSSPEEVLGKTFGLEKRKYILAVSTLLPHKNFDTLIDAFAKLKMEEPNTTKLVIVGLKEKSTGRLTQRIEELKIAGDVVIPGFVKDEDLSLLYNHAALFVSTSVFEGFGMSPVEAMYKKLPTITTTCTSLPEVTQGRGIYYMDPYDSTELAHLMAATMKNRPDDEELQMISDDFKIRYSLNNIAGEYIKYFTGLNKD